MKIAHLITCEPIKNIFGKRNGQFLASVAGTGLNASADTKEGAMETLKRKLENLDRYSQFRRYYHTLSGETLSLYHTFGSWQYDISRPGQIVHGGCMMGDDITQSEAIASVEKHVAQYNSDFEKQKTA